MVNNLKEAKELLERYKSITMEQLEEAYKENPYVNGEKIMRNITGFGKTSSCILCLAVNEVCGKCIYSFRYSGYYPPCIDNIYDEIHYAKNAKDLFAAIQKRISYLTNVIQYYELQK